MRIFAKSLDSRLLLGLLIWTSLALIIFQITALGAAVAAGVTAGVWELGRKMEDITTFRPEIDDKERARKMKRWRMALERSLGWDLEAMSTKND